MQNLTSYIVRNSNELILQFSLRMVPESGIVVLLLDEGVGRINKDTGGVALLKKIDGHSRLIIFNTKCANILSLKCL